MRQMFRKIIWKDSHAYLISAEHIDFVQQIPVLICRMFYASRTEYDSVVHEQMNSTEQLDSTCNYFIAMFDAVIICSGTSAVLNNFCLATELVI